MFKEVMELRFIRNKNTFSAKTGERLTYRVEDTGIGIREQDIEKLYHEFERIEEQRNRRTVGANGQELYNKYICMVYIEKASGTGKEWHFSE